MSNIIYQTVYGIMMGITIIFPIISLFALILCIVKKNLKYALIALWISVIAVALNYKLAGNVLLGSYFDIPHALLYSTNLLFFTIATIYVVYHIKQMLLTRLWTMVTDCFAIGFIIGIIIIFTNLWVNAIFINYRFPNTPLIKTANFYYKTCQHGSIFLKIDRDAHVAYLCPNGYGLIATTKTLKHIPNFLQGKFSTQLTQELASKNSQWE